MESAVPLHSPDEPMSRKAKLYTVHGSPWQKLEGPQIFEAAELGLAVSRSDYKVQEPALRERLLDAQQRLSEADFPVLLLFSGVDGAGKGETANTLSAWMDPRRVVTRAFGAPSQEELERPPNWRYWRDMPPRGQLGVFLSAWYTQPLLDRAYENIDAREFDERLDRIAALERMLAEDGALILKFWMHLGREQQKRRLETLEQDPLLSWRVTRLDWKHWRLYEHFVAASAQLIRRTDTPFARWTIVEGADAHYRNLTIGRSLLDALEHRLEQEGSSAAVPPAPALVEAPEDAESGTEEEYESGVLSRLDMSQELSKKSYRAKLKKYQAKLNLLHRRARAQGTSMILVFEGWDAGGKGGAIRRATAALDARDYQVISIAAPTDEERDHHYLWRFWRHLSRAGRVTVFDRSWYGRVLVERIEGFAKEREWRRAYDEIADFERQILDHGTVLVKFWLHITPDEQEERFLARKDTPYKSWKLTEEDWRNRSRWAEYEDAIDEMVARTSQERAPWQLIPGNDKRFARIAVLERICGALEEALD